MEIAAIKLELPLSQVLSYYGLKPDKHLRLHVRSMMIRRLACRCIIRRIAVIVLVVTVRHMGSHWMR